MANGYYVTAIEDIESLDVVWPDKYLPDGKMARWDINGDGVVATYNYRVDMPPVGYFFHYGNTSHPIKGKFYCNGYDSELKAEICRSLGNPFIPGHRILRIGKRVTVFHLYTPLSKIKINAVRLSSFLRPLDCP
jgi:hypothetical protein